MSGTCCQWLYYFQYAFDFNPTNVIFCGQWKYGDGLLGCLNLTGWLIDKVEQFMYTLLYLFM
jgi:hypothetical protein